MPQRKLIDQMCEPFLAMELCTHYLVNNRLWDFAPIFILNSMATANVPMVIARGFWAVILVAIKGVSGRVYIGRLYIVIKYYQAIAHLSFVQKRALVN